MISHVQTVGIFVRDQQKAKEFYTQKLGFEVIRDDPMGEKARWIEVAPKGAKTHLVLFTPPGMEDRIGTFSNLVFGCEDIQKTYEELKSRGVTFTDPPAKQYWGGTMAQFVDLDGNKFVLHD
jgi:lactoylglutathione lyase